jgi:hypothetical protein
MCLMIRNSFGICVVCARRIPGGVLGGAGLPWFHFGAPKFVFWAVFAILADFVIFSGFLN